MRLVSKLDEKRNGISLKLTIYIIIILSKDAFKSKLYNLSSIEVLLEMESAVRFFSVFLAGKTQ